MTTIPEREDNLTARIDQAHKDRAERPRAHFGASQAGHPCDRWLWLSFRWAVQPDFPGRILRVFRRGHHEEDWIVADLKAAGIKITHTGRTQKRVGFGWHISGSLDGIIERGVPEAVHKQHVAEFKTHSLKSFKDMVAKGVEKYKPIHYAQVQLYMHGTRIDRALYVAVCKDDDQLYFERVRYDKAFAEKLLDRCIGIVKAERMPDPLSADPSWYQCKFCDAHEFCHESKITKHVNCRTCAFSTPEENGTWLCERHQESGIPEEFQHDGCASHVLHPDLVPWEMEASFSPDEAVYIIDGKPIRNGEAGSAHVFTSKELIAGGNACANDLVNAIKETFSGAAIVCKRDGTSEVIYGKAEKD